METSRKLWKAGRPEEIIVYYTKQYKKERKKKFI